MEKSATDICQELKEKFFRRIYLIQGRDPLLREQITDLIKFAFKLDKIKLETSPAISDNFTFEDLLIRVEQTKIVPEPSLISIAFPFSRIRKFHISLLEEKQVDRFLIINNQERDKAFKIEKYFKLEGEDQKGKVAFIQADRIFGIPKIKRWLQNWFTLVYKQEISESLLNSLVDDGQTDYIQIMTEIEKEVLACPHQEPFLKIQTTKATIYDLARSFVTGNPSFYEILEQLKINGTELNLLLWALNRNLQQLLKAKIVLEKENISAIESLKKVGVKYPDQRSFLKVLPLLNTQYLINLLGNLSHLDFLIKNQNRERFWNLITRLFYKHVRNAVRRKEN